MKTVLITYQGNSYKGNIIREESREPHYYWFIFEDSDMQQKFGDVSFVRKEHGLRPTYALSAEKHSDLFSAIKEVLEKNL